LEYFFFMRSRETCTKAQKFKGMDFDGYKNHYSCQTVLTVSKNIMKLGSNRCHFLNFALNGRGERQIIFKIFSTRRYAMPDVPYLRVIRKFYDRFSDGLMRSLLPLNWTYTMRIETACLLENLVRVQKAVNPITNNHRKY